MTDQEFESIKCLTKKLFRKIDSENITVDQIDGVVNRFAMVAKRVFKNAEITGLCAATTDMVLRGKLR